MDRKFERGSNEHHHDTSKGSLVDDEEKSRITPYDDAYPTCERTSAKLLIYPGSLDPRWVTRKLGVQPSQTQIKGERKPTSHRKDRSVPLSAWFLSSEGKNSSLDLRRHLDWLLGKIEPAGAALKDLQCHPDVQMTVDCVWWSARG